MATIANIAPKLQRLLLLLSSDQPGEVVAAAHAIGKTPRTAGADWHDWASGLTSPSSTKPKFQEEPEARGERDWHTMRDYCFKHPTRLREREREFVESLRKWRGHLTTKQRDWLEAIYERLQRRAA